MRILVTGATGFIGSAVARRAGQAGHTVHALTHDADSADRARAAGLEPVEGDLRNTERMAHLAAAADAVVHVGHTGGADAAEVDTAATHAMLSALHGTRRAFVYTSGAWVLGPGVSNEDSPANPVPLVRWRAALEQVVTGAAPLVRSVVIRPGIAWSADGPLPWGGGIPGQVARGGIPVIGDGLQRWPLVHVDDLAELYLLALEVPGGSILHGVSSTTSMLALALARAADGAAAVEQLNLEEATRRLGDFAGALALDQQVSSARTVAATGWRPMHGSPWTGHEAQTEVSRAAG